MSLMKELESWVRRQLEQIKELPQKVREDAMDMYKRDKKFNFQESEKTRQAQRTKELAKKNLEAPALKRKGRPNMARSYLEKDEMESNNMPLENQEYLDNLKYFKD